MNKDNKIQSPGRSLQTWEIVLLVLGFPLWFSLLAAAASVILALYVSIWAVIISLWAIWVALIVCVPCGIAAAAFFWFRGERMNSALLIGASFYCAGLVIVGFFGCVAVSKGVVMLTVKIAEAVKNILAGKENAQ